MTTNTIVWAVYVILGLVVLALVVLAILALFAGRTDPNHAHSSQPGQPVLDRTDARNWKMGFYLNPQDPALIVPKRNPAFGTTINIGHPRGRLVAASILLGIALLIVISGVPVLLALR